jgi:osmotically inducible protein OsmC
MPEPRRVRRHAHVHWIHHADGGQGHIRGDGKAFSALPLSIADEQDSRRAHTTPGELVAAAMSASFAATLADLLARGGTPAKELTVDGTCQLDDRGCGRSISGLHIQASARGTGLDAEDFADCADRALACCPVSHALSAEIAISIEVRVA